MACPAIRVHKRQGIAYRGHLEPPAHGQAGVDPGKCESVQ